MKSKNRPKAILKALSALSVLLPTAGVHAADGARDLRPNTATASRTNVSSTEKKKDNEKTKMDIREFEKALFEKGNPIRESFGDDNGLMRDTRCTGGNCGY